MFTKTDVETLERLAKRESEDDDVSYLITRFKEVGQAATALQRRDALLRGLVKELL